MAVRSHSQQASKSFISPRGSPTNPADVRPAGHRDVPTVAAVAAALAVATAKCSVPPVAAAGRKRKYPSSRAEIALSTAMTASSRSPGAPAATVVVAAAAVAVVATVAVVAAATAAAAAVAVVAVGAGNPGDFSPANTLKQQEGRVRNRTRLSLCPEIGAGFSCGGAPTGRVLHGDDRATGRGQAEPWNRRAGCPAGRPSQRRRGRTRTFEA